MKETSTVLISIYNAFNELRGIITRLIKSYDSDDLDVALLDWERETLAVVVRNYLLKEKNQLNELRNSFKPAFSFEYDFNRLDKEILSFEGPYFTNDREGLSNLKKARFYLFALKILGEQTIGTIDLPTEQLKLYFEALNIDNEMEESTKLINKINSIIMPIFKLKNNGSFFFKDGLLFYKNERVLRKKLIGNEFRFVAKLYTNISQSVEEMAIKAYIRNVSEDKLTPLDRTDKNFCKKIKNRIIKKAVNLKMKKLISEAIASKPVSAYALIDPLYKGS